MARLFILAALFSVMSGATSAATELLLFGGSNHDQFLGCLGCGKYDSGSVCNKYGKGGRYDSDSIFNRYGTFGSRYSDSSPWNRYTSSASVPVLVDRAGKFYGYLTINVHRSDSVKFSRELKSIFDEANGNLEIVRDILCKSF